MNKEWIVPILRKVHLTAFANLMACAICLVFSGPAANAAAIPGNAPREIAIPDEHRAPNTPLTPPLAVYEFGSATASEMGQLAAARVSEDNYRFLLDEMLYTEYGDNRGFGLEHDLAQANIASLFEDYGLIVTLEPFSFSFQTYYNVVGTKLGTVYPDQEFVVGAHYDSVNNPGADDNASGVALVLEAARVLGEADSAYTIRFVAFDREEQGLYGSYAYVDAHAGDDILAMISADMVAYNKGTNAVDIFGNSASSSLKNNLAAAVAAYGEGLSAGVFSSSGGSDHVPFQNAGYQAVLFIEDWGNPYYHTQLDSTDTHNYIDYTFATNATRSVVGYLVDQAQIIVAPLEVSAPLEEPQGVVKNRYLSFMVPPNELGFETAVRVRLTTLSTSAAPGSGYTAGGAEPEYRYVSLFRDDQDQPVFDCPDSEAFGTTMKCATLSCDPEYRDWAGELGNEVLHVTSPAVVPGSQYNVSVLLSLCEGIEASCELISDELPLSTGQWGDVDPGQLDVLDVAAVVDQVKDISGAPGKAQAQLQPRELDPFANVSVLDVAYAVDALREAPYPFDGPDPCP